MTDVFVSYASADRERVLPIVRALEADGLSVWWDRNIPPGPSFDRAIETAIDAAGCMLVVWSAAAVESEWVRSEVDEGARRGILVPARIDDALPPLAYRRRQTADLRAPAAVLAADPNYRQLLAAVRATLAGETAAPLPVAAPAEARRGGAWWTGVVALAAGAAIGIAVSLAWRTDAPPGQLRTVSFELQLPAGVTLPPVASSRITIDRNGERIYVIGRHPDGFNGVYARRLSELTFTEFEELRRERVAAEIGTDLRDLTGIARGPRAGALAVGFGGQIFTREPGRTRVKLRATSVNSLYSRMDWSPRDVLAVNDQGKNRIILSYPDGTERSLGQSDDAGLVSMPAFSADERLLFVVRGRGPGSFRIQALDVDSGVAADVVRGIDPRTTRSGLLLFLQEGKVHAVRFDATSGTAIGAPRVVLDGVENNGRRAQYEFADDGTLVYQPALRHATELAWIARDGSAQPVATFEERLYSPQLSPSQDRVVLVRREGRDVFVASLAGGLLSRIAATTGVTLGPTWSPDGSRVAFGHWDTSPYVELWLAPASGGGARPLLAGSGHVMAGSWTPDGAALLFAQCPDLDGRLGCDVGMVDIDDPAHPRWLLHSGYGEDWPALTSDGRWLAYGSTEFGEPRVVVRRASAPEDGVWQAPGGSCGRPRFSADATRLFSVCAEGLYETPVVWGDTPVFGTPRLAFAGDFHGFDWDLSADGARVLRLIDRTPDADRLIVVLTSG